MIGDIAAGSSTTVNFIVKIDKNAPAGEYDLLADISYQYLNYAEQFGTDSIRYYYKTVELDQELPITIKRWLFLRFRMLQPILST